MTDVPELVDEVIRLCRRRSDRLKRGFRHEPYVYEELAGSDPSAQAAIIMLMDRLADAGILEYGVSLRTAWVQDYLPDIEARIAAFKQGVDYDDD